MEIGLRPCQDPFLHPILVHYRKIIKIQPVNGHGAHQKNIEKTN